MQPAAATPDPPADGEIVARAVDPAPNAAPVERAAAPQPVTARDALKAAAHAATDEDKGHLAFAHTALEDAERVLASLEEKVSEGVKALIADIRRWL